MTTINLTTLYHYDALNRLASRSGSPHLQAPGFNGECLDPLTGHYLLGNGYRAYNPVLMRFNSPDSLSPFGGGGLNAYAYGVGDPVNKLDPDGHTPRFIKSLLRPLGLFKKRSTARYTNAFTLGENVSVFDTVNHQSRVLTINAHGRIEQIDGARALAMGNEGHLTSDLLHYRLQKSGVNFDSYDSMHMISCYSAAEGADSFAAQMAQHTKLSVLGYKKEVIVQPGATWTTQQINDASREVRKLSNSKFELNYRIKIFTKNTFKKGSEYDLRFSYEPVWHSYL